MLFFHDTTDFRTDSPCAVTLGKFDGIHRGHQILMNKVLDHARCHDLQSAVFALNAKKTDLLLTEQEQRTMLEDMGMDVLVECPFVPEISGMSPEQFVKEVLVDRLHARYITVGTDFRFGHDRAGDAAFLERCQETYGFHVDVIEKECYKGREISSTYVREALAEGNMELVTELLGRPYGVHGVIVHGRHMGTGMGMPTANLIPDQEKMLPPNGVYMTVSYIEGKRYEGVTNIGFKPTVGEKFRGVETYLFDGTGDLYDREMTTLLYHYERPEIRFPNLEALKEQIRHDIAAGREYFIEQGNVENQLHTGDSGSDHRCMRDDLRTDAARP